MLSNMNSDSNGVLDLDQLYEIPNNFYDYDDCNNLISYLSSPYDHLFPLSPLFSCLPELDFDPCQLAKRQKCYGDCSPLPEFQIAEVKKSGDQYVSGQSIAARERRRKITEKTQELGKLIPGGSKMNTAEMLQAAYKYVKFLQAQVEIFKFMNSFRGSKEEYELEDLNVLITSPIIEEKLYLEEKCLVPTEFVKGLIKNHDIKRKSSICSDLNSLISGD